MCWPLDQYGQILDGKTVSVLGRFDLIDVFAVPERILTGHGDSLEGTEYSLHMQDAVRLHFTIH